MKHKSKRSLKRVFISSFLMIGIIPMFIIGAIFVEIIRQSIYESQVSTMNQIASIVSNSIDQWGDDQLSLVQEIARLDVIEKGNVEAIYSKLKLKMQQNNSIKDILYVDTKGTVIADGLVALNENMSDKPYFKEALKGYSTISSVAIEDNEPTIYFATPVKRNNQVTGVVISEIAIWGIEQSIGNVFFAKDSTLFTFDCNGWVTWHTDNSKSGNEHLMDGHHKMFEPLVTQALRGNRQTSTVTIEGKRELVVCNYIDSLNWGMMATLPYSQLYRGFNLVVAFALPLMGIACLIIIGFAIFQQGKVVKPIISLANSVQKVAKGDLTIRAEVRGARELQIMSEAFNEMTQSLQVLVGGVYTKNKKLHETAENMVTIFKNVEVGNKGIVRAMETITGGTVTQAAQTQEVLASTRELSEKIEEAKKNIGEMDYTVGNSKTALVKAQGEVEHLKEETAMQKSLVKQTMLEAEKLQEAVNHINEITQTINNIANQTRLLALNASIEAVHAGESGKGFAVVAERVSDLATQSQQATKDITSILDLIEGQTASTRLLMKQINEKMDQQNDAVDETYKIFMQVENVEEMIIQNVESFDETIDYIHGFGQNLLSVTNNLANIAEENAAGTEESTASLEAQLETISSLNEISTNIKIYVDELQHNIHRFKISEEME